MYAAHLADGLAIKAAEPLPDLLWLGLSIGGVEVVGRGTWFDGWSHSVASILVQAPLVCALCWRQGFGVSADLRYTCGEELAKRWRRLAA